MKPLYHIVPADDWAVAVAAGCYTPNGYATEGFIHLSELEQLLRPANLLYVGRSDLVILVIAPCRLGGDVRYEPGSHGENELFPHLYGPLNTDAVTDVVAFPCSVDGSFALPPGLAEG